jgi:hypothetical protein
MADAASIYRGAAAMLEIATAMKTVPIISYNGLSIILDNQQHGGASYFLAGIRSNLSSRCLAKSSHASAYSKSKHRSIRSAEVRERAASAVGA